VRAPWVSSDFLSNVGLFGCMVERGCAKGIIRGGPSDYAMEQEMEIEALESILMDDMKGAYDLSNATPPRYTCKERNVSRFMSN
jgi:hypothetical protein